jgi:hypothetical protein
MTRRRQQICTQVCALRASHPLWFTHLRHHNDLPSVAPTGGTYAHELRAVDTQALVFVFATAAPHQAALRAKFVATRNQGHATNAYMRSFFACHHRYLMKYRQGSR